MESEYDLVVIGSGPGGQRAAVQAAKLKKSVLVIEKEELGGACVHSGTVPSKTLREAAIADSQHDDETLKRVMNRLNAVLENETKVMHNQLQRNNVHYINGVAGLMSPNQVGIQTKDKQIEVKAKYIVIATGTSPNHPEGIPFDKKVIFDSDTVLHLKELPRTLAVLGAGVIGSEYASIFNRLGVKVTLIDRRKELLRSIDEEIVNSLKHHFEENGIDLLMGAEIGKIDIAKDSYEMDAARIEINGKPKFFSAALICLGRHGNVNGSNLEKAGVAASERGLIEVNEHFQTSVPHIYAVGDVIGPPALAASSSEQGRLASCHAFGLKTDGFPHTFPYGIYTIPEISTVGLQEHEIKEKKIPYVVGVARYKELARGQIIGDHHGMLKLMVHKENHKVLGAHIIGTGATELVHIGQVALALDAKIEFFVQNVFNYPTLAEAYKVAGYNAMNQLV